MENTPGPKTVAIVILNYKTPDLVVDCLQSLEEQIEPGVDVIVVDNASNDGSAEKIEARIDAAHWGSWARVLRSPVTEALPRATTWASAPSMPMPTFC